MMPATDFLRDNQPTAATVRVLWYLNTFFQGKPWQGGFAYEQELRRCRLDYSPASLERLDGLLKQIRHDRQPDADAFFGDMANQNFLLVAAFYCGEVLGRAKRQAAVWLRYEDLMARHPDAAAAHPPALWTDFLATFPQESGTPELFFPLRAIYACLFGSENEAAQSSTMQAVLDRLPENGIPETAHSLPEPPPQSLDFSIRRALATTPRHDLPYLQMLPAPELADTPLYRQIDALGTLYRQGRAVWAALVQADPDLTKPGNAHPATAEFVYDPSGRTDPDTLLQAAKTLQNLQNGNDEDEDGEHGYARPAVTATRLLHKVPSFISHMSLQTARVFVWRPHLPDGVLSRPLLPVLIDESAYALTLLPARYWAHTEWYQQWQTPDRPAEPNNETAPAFAALLAEDRDFWRHYPEMVRPLAEELPDLGHCAEPYTAEYTDGGKQRVRNYRTAAQSNYPRFSEDLPDTADVDNCLSELQAIGSTAYPPAVEKYARLRQADFGGILIELANPAAHEAIGTAPLPEAANMLKQQQPSAYTVSRFVRKLMRQSRNNHAAAVYLAYFYATGTLLPQSLYEAAAWAHRAADGGDWRGTQLLAEMLIAAPQAAPELMYERISTEAYTFLPELRPNKISAKDIEIQKKSYLNHPEAVAEIIRNLLAQASAQGNPVAPTRLQQLIIAGRLPAVPPSEKCRNIRHWLSAYAAEHRHAESPVLADPEPVPLMPEPDAGTIRPPVHPPQRRNILWWMLLPVLIPAAAALVLMLLPAADLPPALVKIQSLLRPFWDGLQAFLKDLAY